MRTWRTMIAVSAAAMLIPAVASAQWRFTTWAGVYTPATEFAKVSVTQGTTTANASFKQKAGFAIGANANTWFQDRFGFEGSLGYVNSDVKASASLSDGGFGQLSGSGSENAYLVQTSAKLLYALTPSSGNTFFYLGAGPAVIFNGGKAYDAVNGVKLERDTEIGGTALLGVRMRVNDVLSAKLGADGFFYSAKAKMTDTTDPSASLKFDSRMQSDFIFSLGLSFALPNR